MSPQTREFYRNHTINPHPPNTDDNVGAASWSAIECNTGIICACLPTLKPLLARLMPRLMSQFSGNQPTYGTGMSTHRSGNWDEATLGAPGEDPEYGAGDPERVLALVPGGGFRYGGKALKGGEKDLGQITKTTSVTEFSEHQSQEQIGGSGGQQASSFESSSPLRK